jgi:lipopolysaccharide/colanic/teichoic acid biosynthesis glycosyltransferase
MVNSDARTREIAARLGRARWLRSVWLLRSGIALAHMRRLGDIVIAGALLALTLPLLVIAGLAVKCESQGPILERQMCIARGGRRFYLLRFRTTAHAPQRMRGWRPHVTTVGQFLRYTRIESLPQLVNVLRGEMSLCDPDQYSPSLD